MVIMEEQIKAGIKALLLCKKKLKKETILDHDDMKVMLQISAVKVAPGGIKQTIKLPMPAPFSDSAEVCLFVKDLKRGIRVDHDQSTRHWRQHLEDRGVTRVAEVMPLRQVKAEYSMYEARRKLCDAYDVFLSDVRVTRLLPTLLGKHFVVKKKQPVSVNLESSDLVREIDSALNAAYLHLHNTGACSTVQIGRCGQSEDQLLANVLSAVNTLKTKFPGGLRNVRSLHLKLDKSPAVPVFLNDVSSNSVPVPAARRQPGSGRETVVGELSTARAPSDVVVDRFGNVTLVQKRALSDDEEESEEEEEDQRSGGRHGKKRTKQAKKAKSAPPAAPAEDATPVQTPTPGSEVREDSEDSSEEEDRELEEHEARFLKQLEAKKAATPAPAEAERKAKSAVKTKKKMAQKDGSKKTGKKGVSAVAGKKVSKKVAKKADVAKSPKTEKAVKKYAKKTGKKIGAVKKVK